MNKNIWIINQYTGSPYHGMNYRSYYLAKEFIKNGHNVTIFASSYSHLFINSPKTRGLFTSENIDGIDYIWVKTPSYKKSKSIGRIINMLVFMILLFFVNIFKMKKPDEIIISSLSIFPVLNAFIWSKIFKIKFIFEVRDLWPLTLIELGNISKNNLLVQTIGWFEQFGYKKAKYVVSVLPNAKSYMIEKGMSSKKFKYIPNGIYIEDNIDRELNDNIKNKIPKNKFIIGYAGTIGIANALEYLMEVAVLMKDNSKICFVLVGNGGEKNNLEEKVKLDKLNNVLFFNAIPKNEIQSLLSLFDVCYIGWHKHSLYRFGISANKIFDYMYSGTPIIHSTNAENNPIKVANAGISVSAENVLEIRESIEKMSMLKKTELEKLGRNGKEYVKMNHDYKILSEKYEKLFT